MRRAAVELHGDELRPLGVTTSAPSSVLTPAERHPPLPVALSRRVLEIMDDVPHRGGDRPLLRASLQDEGRRARRLLERIGVDTDALLARVDDDSFPVSSGLRTVDEIDIATLVGAGHDKTAWTSASHIQELGIPVERVWALVSDCGTAAGADGPHHTQLRGLALSLSQAA